MNKGVDQKPRMRFGVALSQDFQPSLARQVEESGFDGLWVGGHLLWRKPMLDPIVQLAAYAQVTKRVRLGTSVLLLPLYHPGPLAKALTTLDVISSGRLTLGVGIGGENPAEFEAAGIEVGERGPRANEAIDLLKHVWKGRADGFGGRFFQFPEGSMEPLPIQAGGPPVWVGGRSDGALTRAAGHADGWMGIFLRPSRYAEAAATLDQRAAAAGRDLVGFTFAHYVWAHAEANSGRGLASVRRHLLASYNQEFDDRRLGQYAIIGNVESCRERVAAYAAAGCSYLILKPACPQEELPEQIERFAQAFLAGA